MSMKRVVMVGVVLVIVAGGYFWYQKEKTGVEVATERVERGTVLETVSVTGELVPVEYADLSFQSVGRVARVSVKEGDWVTKGQVLATLDTAVLESQLREARIAQAIVEENEKLARRGWDDLKPEERKAKKLASEQAREDVRTLIATLRQSNLVAPMDGFLSLFDVRVGETVTAATLVARVAKDTGLIVEARVPESDITSVALGMEAEATFDALSSDDIFKIEVVEIDRAATVVQDVVSYSVKFRFLSTDERLREGMTADIDIVTAKRENVLTVPFRALSKEGGKMYAERKKSDNTFEKIEVKVGLEGDEGTVEIFSGLQEGDEVSISAKSK